MAIAFPNWLPLAALVVIGVLAVGAALMICIGLFEARSLITREFAAYFLSPIAYVVFVVFLAVTGHLFHLAFQLLSERGPRGIEFPMQTLFTDERFWLVYLFIPPLLTMRLFAEERSTGTLETLMTAPLRDWQIVLAKYCACLAFYTVLWLPTLLYLPVFLGIHHAEVQPTWTRHAILAIVGIALIAAAVAVSRLSFVGTRGHMLALLLFLIGAALFGFGAWNHYHQDEAHWVVLSADLDPAPVACSYLGLFLAGAMFLALGLLVSSMVRNQLVAALVSLGIGLAFVLTGFWRPDLDPGSAAAQVVYSFSVPIHFGRDFGRGLLDTRHIVLYVSVAGAALFLAVRSLEGRRWQ